MTLYKYKTAEFIEDVIINKRLWCSRYDALNDPMEWAFKSEKDKKDIEELINDTGKERWRICCLSKSKQYGLMWSMYGDEHRGVCVEVDIDVNNEEFHKYNDLNIPNGPNDHNWRFGNVNYTNNPLSIEDTHAELKQVLWTKSKQWSHEQEVRFVTKATSKNAKTYLPIKIKAIYLGRRMNKDKAEEIKELCDKHHVQYVDLSDPNNERLVNYWNDYTNKPYEE